MNLSSAQRHALHWGGSSLALIGILFVGFRLHSYWLDIDLSRIAPLAWGFIAVLSVIYGLANFLLAMAWWYLLQNLGTSASRLGSFRIFGMSQLAKYVPGNIFHLAGRQALGMAADIAAGVLAKSIAWEMGLIAVAGAQFGWLILPLLVPAFPEAISILLLLCSATLIGVFLQGMIGRQAAWSFLWQICFLIASGFIFIALLVLVAGGDGLLVRHWLTIGGAYIAAWLVGLVTPGAPAGVGVREMILLLLLRGMVNEQDLLIAVVLGRLVTVVGDLLFFVAAYFIPVKYCGFEKNHD